MQNRIVYIMALLLSILILFVLSFSVYNLPSADDFAYGIVNNSLTMFQRSLNDYIYGSSGRIFSNFLYYNMAGYGNSHLYFYKIIPLISMMLWIFVCYLVFCELFINYSKKIILSLLIVFQAVWMFSLASVNDTIFWLGGITNYFIPFSLFFLILLFIYKAYNSKDIIKYSLLLLTANLILFIISFSNESLFFTFYVLYLLTFIYGLLYKQSKLIQSIIPSVIVLTIALFIIVLSPGSVNRMGGGNGDILFGIYRGLMTSLERAVNYYFTSMVIPASLIFYFTLNENIKKVFPNVSFKVNGIIFILLGIIFSWSAHFVISYGLGASGLPPRAKVIPQTFSIITFIIANIYFFTHIDLKSKQIFTCWKKSIFIYSYIIISIILCFDVTGTIVSLGEHKTYYAKQIERLNIIQYADKSKPEIILKTIDIAPYPIAPIDARLLRDDCSYYVNETMARYYNYNGCIRLEQGIDGENSKSKQIFRKINYFFSDGARIWFYSLF